MLKITQPNISCILDDAFLLSHRLSGLRCGELRGDRQVKGREFCDCEELLGKRLVLLDICLGYDIVEFAARRDAEEQSIHTQRDCS